MSYYGDQYPYIFQTNKDNLVTREQLSMPPQSVKNANQMGMVTTLTRRPGQSAEKLQTHVQGQSQGAWQTEQQGAASVLGTAQSQRVLM